MAEDREYLSLWIWLLPVFTFYKGTVFTEMHPNLYAMSYPYSQVLGV